MYYYLTIDVFPDTKETITIHRNNVEEIVDRYKYPYSNNLYSNSLSNMNEYYSANNNFLPNFENTESPSTTSSNNVITDYNYNGVNNNYILENIEKYNDNYARNTYNNYDKFQQVYNLNGNVQENLNQEQRPNNFFSNYLNGQYYPNYQNVIPSYNLNNFGTDNAYLNTDGNYLQNYKPSIYRADNSYSKTNNPWKYDKVNNLYYNINKPTKFCNYKENYIPGKYHDRIWRTWNDMDIIIGNKGAPLKIEFGKDDKNTIELYNMKKNNNKYNQYKQQERNGRSQKVNLKSI